MTHCAFRAINNIIESIDQAYIYRASVICSKVICYTEKGGLNVNLPLWTQALSNTLDCRTVGLFSYLKFH